ncbi:MAG: DJ-1/PfpI family protein [Gammaproteobacteria bacterium]|nr:DJ-1/PfpI family protein [Gammaproteobacteria bacterium]
MAKVLVPLADGFEELEAVTIIDLLRRAGIEVNVAALQGGTVTGSHGITITADNSLDQALHGEYDMVVLPGGQPGADNLEADSRLCELLRKMANSGKFTAAICAAPKVLAAAGLLENKTATSFPGYLDRMDIAGMNYSDKAVVRDGKVLTSRGPGTAMDFALTLIEQLAGPEKRRDVESRLQRPK